mgnify:FL=1
MENKIYSTAIIGGGPAGYSAALFCARAGLDTVVLEKLSAGGQMAETGKIENYPGFDDGIDGFELGMKMEKSALKFGAESKYCRVISADLKSNPKVIKTTDGHILSHSVIIATGAFPRKLAIKDEEKLIGKGVAYCAYCDGMMYKGKTVAVIGGGDSAAEDALYLSSICHKVYLIHRRAKLRASESYIKALEKHNNIELILNAEPLEFIHGDTLTGIRLGNTVDNHIFDLDCNAVFVAIGRVPESEIFKDQLETDKYGYIKAGEDCATNMVGVFAAGDVRTKALRQVVTAVADGANAAKSAKDYIDI